MRSKMSLRRDVLWNLVGNVVPLLVAVVTIPWLLTTLGDAGFGVLALLWALIGYFGIFDFGIGRALTYEVSRRQKNENPEAIGRVAFIGLALTFATGVLGAALVYFVVAPNSWHWFKVEPSMAPQVVRAFEWIAAAVIPATITSGVRGIFEGLTRFRDSNIYRSIIGVLMFVVPAAVAIYTVDLGVIAKYFAIARWLVCVGACVHLNTRVRFLPSRGAGEARALLSYGGWVTLSGVISPLMVYGDRFLVSGVLGASVLPFYAIPQEGLQRLLIIPASLAGALLPRMSGAVAPTTRIRLYRDNLRRTAIVMLAVCVLTAIVAHPILAIWISHEFAEKSIIVVWILSFGIWLNSMAQMPMTLLHALGKPRIPAILHVFELIFYVGLVFLLSNAFGLVGAALAWTLRASADYALLTILARRCILELRRE